MLKKIKAYEFFTILGIIIGVAGIIAGGWAFGNWESHNEFNMSFPKNTAEKISSYYALNSDSLAVAQHTGNSSCKYTIYHQKRNQNSYTKVAENLKFTSNDEFQHDPINLSSSWWNDIRFKVKKTAGTSVASELIMSLGKSN